MDILNFSAYEQVAYQVQQEENIELRERVRAIQSQRKDLERLSPNEACDLLEFETDADELKTILQLLSKTMMEKIEVIRSERRYEMNEKIRRMLGEKDKHLSQLLRFRVVDAINPKKTAVVIHWSPAEDWQETIKEGKAIEIINSTAAAFTKEIQITAGKSSIFKLAKLESTQEKFRKYFRSETKIQEIKADFKPPQDEFDVALIVVRVDPKPVQDLHKVYVADEETDILCINFWSNLSANAFDDVIVSGNILYARNLQWRSTHTADKIPQAYAINDSTVFIAHPKNESFKTRLNELRNSVTNTAEFLIQCNDKIAELQSGNVSLVNKEHQREASNNSQNKMNRFGRPNFSKSLDAPSTRSSQELAATKNIRKKRLGMSHIACSSRLFNFSQDAKSNQKPAISTKKSNTR